MVVLWGSLREGSNRERLVFLGGYATQENDDWRVTQHRPSLSRAFDLTGAEALDINPVVHPHGSVPDACGYGSVFVVVEGDHSRCVVEDSAGSEKGPERPPQIPGAL